MKTIGTIPYEQGKTTHGDVRNAIDSAIGAMNENFAELSLAGEAGWQVMNLKDIDKVPASHMKSPSNYILVDDGGIVLGRLFVFTDKTKGGYTQLMISHLMGTKVTDWDTVVVQYRRYAALMPINNTPKGQWTAWKNLLNDIYSDMVTVFHHVVDNVTISPGNAPEIGETVYDKKRNIFLLSTGGKYYEQYATEGSMAGKAPMIGKMYADLEDNTYLAVSGGLSLQQKI